MEPDMRRPPLHRRDEAPGDLLPLGVAVHRAPVLVSDVVLLRPRSPQCQSLVWNGNATGTETCAAGAYLDG